MTKNRVADVSHAYDNMHDLTPENGPETDPKTGGKTAPAANPESGSG